jgi:hypothetical protein
MSHITKIEPGATYVLTVPMHLTHDQATDMRVVLEQQTDAFWVIVGGMGNE